MPTPEEVPSSPVHIDEHELAEEEPDIETQPIEDDGDTQHAEEAAQPTAADETQLEPEEETQPADETQQTRDATEETTETGEAQAKKPPRKRNPASTSVNHEPGKSVFPVSRVQKILKADKVRGSCPLPLPLDLSSRY